VFAGKHGEPGLVGPLGILALAGGLVMEGRESVAIERELISALDGDVAFVAERVEFLAELGQVLEVGGALLVEFALRGLELLGQLTVVFLGARLDASNGLVAFSLQGLDLVVHAPQFVAEALELLPDLAALRVDQLERGGMLLLLVA
jgi:hypothetical protein